MIIILRLLVTLTLVCIGLMVPWWIFILALGVACFVFPWYLEGIFVAGILDAWFGNAVLTGWPHIYITSAVCWYILTPLIRRRLFIDA